MHTAHDDDIRFSLGSLLGQCQTVSHEVSQILDDSFRIVMRHDDGILLPAKFPDLIFQIKPLCYGFIHKPLVYPLFLNHIYIINSYFYFLKKSNVNDDRLLIVSIKKKPETCFLSYQSGVSGNISLFNMSLGSLIL